MALLDKHGVTASGRVRVQEIRGQPPERRVGAGPGRVTGVYASRKTGLTQEYESVPELCAIMSWEHDKEVLEYYTQPAGSLSIMYCGKGGRRVRSRHVPDAFILSRDYVGYFEVKPKASLEKLVVVKPGRWQRDSDGAWRSEPAEVAAAAFGLGYRIICSDDLSWNLVQNAEILQGFGGRELETVGQRRIEEIRTLVRRRPGISLEELAEKTGGGDDVMVLVAKGELWVDLQQSLLIRFDDVEVFEDRKIAEIWAKARGSQSEFVGCGESDGKLSDSAVVELGCASKRDLAEAERRLVLIQPVLDGKLRTSEVEGASARTVARWIEAYRRGVSTVIPGWWA